MDLPVLNGRLHPLTVYFAQMDISIQRVRLVYSLPLRLQWTGSPFKIANRFGTIPRRSYLDEVSTSKRGPPTQMGRIYVV